MTFDPPTKAASHLPIFISLYARSSAYIEELHAVSTVKDGPIKPNANDIRFAKSARAKLSRRNED